MKHKILVIEDEKAIQRAIVSYLTREGYEVFSTDDGAKGLEMALADDYDLILLDMILPSLGGEAVLTELRKAKETPVMIISALKDEYIQLDAYHQKIDDYVVKPFSMNILICKVSMLLNRLYPNKKEIIICEDIELHTGEYEVYRGGELIELTAKEFELLQVLLLHKGQIFTRDELYTAVWGYESYGDTRTIDVHIGKIRKKTGLKSIITVAKVGYKMGV